MTMLKAMMRRKTDIFICTLAVLLMLPLCNVMAQSKEIRKKIESIKENRAYKYGEGSGTTFDEAYKFALEKMMESINVFVASTYSLSQKNVTKGGSNDFREHADSNLSTYSMGTLQDVGRIEYGEEPEAKVFVYVLENSVRKMFDTRLAKVRSLISYGLKDEERFRVADALRYYTWALCLLQTLPMGDTATFVHNGQDEMAKVWLHGKINSILADSKIGVVSVEDVDEPRVKRRVYLQLSYHDQLVDNFAFSFHNGMRYIGPVYVSDGRAVAEFSERLSSDEFDVKIEYLFRSQAQTLDQELALVMENIDLPKFSAALKHVGFKQENALGSRKKKRSVAVKETDGILLKETGMTLASLETNRVALETVSDPQPYKSVMAEIIEIVRNKDYAAAREFFTESGYAMFDTLIRNGNVTLLEPIDSLRLVKYGETVICRKLPMQFKFRNNRQFVNDVVFRFNAETKKIESLAFALTRRSENDILTADKKWKEDWRMDLICFLEDYQTAYALKRIDYLESIFSDDALIVTGTVLKHKANSAGAGSDLPGASFEEVRYTKYTKDEFIRKLHYSFDSKEYINLRFNDTEVVKGSGPRDGIFAMQISQDYYSNNYGDTGYLTLLVDLREELPVIKVRVWQQRKDPEFTARALLNR